MSSDPETSNSSKTTAVRKRVKVPRFHEEWLLESGVDEYIDKSDDPRKFRCTLCYRDYLANDVSRLKHHVLSKGHRKKYLEFLNQPAPEPGHLEDALQQEVIIIQSVEKNWKKFKNHWVQKPLCRNWLQAVEDDPYSGFCTACNEKFSCISGKVSLDRHAQSEKHLANCAKNGVEVISEQRALEIEDGEGSFELRKSQLELEYAEKIAHLNISFRSGSEILRFCQEKAIKHSDEFAQMTCSATKIKSLVTNVIAPVHKHRLAKILQQNPFSVYLDETTGRVKGIKYVTVLARYIDPDTTEQKVELLSLISLEPTKSKATDLFSKFKGVLNQFQIPITNVLAISISNASTIDKINNSFQSELENLNPRVITVKCICNSIALIAKDAFRVFPIAIEKFVQDLVTFVRVPARVFLFRNICKKFLGRTVQLTKFCKTQWLSRYQCILKILESWECLKEFIKLIEKDYEENETFIFIKQNLENSQMYATLLFLESVLKIFDEYNTFFQSKHCKIHLLSQKSFSFLQEVGEKFLSPFVMECLRDDLSLVSQLDYDNDANHLNIDEINLGAACNSELELMDLEDVREIKENALLFLITAAKGIAERLYISDELYQKFEVLEPDDALNEFNRDESWESIKFIAERLSTCEDLENLEAEWRRLPFEESFSDDMLSNLDDDGFEHFWKDVMKLRNKDDTPKYPDLIVFISAVMTLPHSNTDAEQAFSLLHEVVANLRTHLADETVDALCVLKAGIVANKTLCKKVDGDHLFLMRHENLYARASSPKKQKLADRGQ